MHWLVFCTYFWKRSRRWPGEEFRPSSSLLTQVPLHMLFYSSWLASKIEPRLTELYSSPLRDRVTGAGSSTTCRVGACFIHRLRSAELSSMSVGSIVIIYWRALKIVWPAIVKSDHRKGLECSLLLTSVMVEPVFELHAASLNCCPM
jgi:hypothetical protein